jgi:hypothetical protein
MRFSVFIVLFFNINAVAQDWYQGTIILKNEKTLHGEISLQSDHDAVFLKNGDAVMVYPAHKIQSFHFLDKESRATRKFITLEMLFGVGSMHLIYELVLEGEVNVIRKERAVWYSVYYESMDYDYYILQEDQFIPINKFRKKIYPLLLENDPELKAYARENALGAGRLTDVLKIIEHYNERRLLTQEVASTKMP